MDIKRFEYLLRIADYGSFSKAATVIGLTQPSLGRQIRKLENECGFALLYRNGRGASLTPEGMRLLSRLRPLLKEIDSVITDIRSEQKAISGAVTLGMTPALSRIIGYPFLRDARQKYPHITLNVVTGYSGYLLEWLTEGRIDVGILDNARRADHLIFDHIAELPLSLISASNNRPPIKKSASSIDLAALKRMPLVLPTRNHGLRRTVDIAVAEADIELDIQYEIDAHDLAREIVIAGAAHTIMSALAIRSEIDQGILIATPINPVLSTQLLCGTALNRPVSGAANAIVRLMKDKLLQITVRAE